MLVLLLLVLISLSARSDHDGHLDRWRQATSFHAFVSSSDRPAPPGYFKLTLREFRQFFRDAELLDARNSSTCDANCDHRAIVVRQFQEIQALQAQLALLQAERDALALQNEKLLFQLQVVSEASALRCASLDRLPLVAAPDQRNDAARRAILDKFGSSADSAAVVIQRAFRSFRVRRKFVELARIASKLHFSPPSLSSSSSSADSNAPFPISVSLSNLNSELVRKRRYRVALNLFNKLKPAKGLAYLVEHGFVEESPDQMAQFLLTRKGLSKKMIGEFLGDPEELNQRVLRAFLSQIDFSNTPTIDLALRKFQSFFRFPGEAQKIERMLEEFANALAPSLSMSRDEVFILSFAIIMLNTDLHTPSNKQRMTAAQWIKNLGGVFKDGDLNQEFLLALYERVKQNELRTGPDHSSHVLRVQQSLCVSSSKPKPVPNLVTTWRRLVCFCRLYEVPEKQKLLAGNPNKHQREIFLFNDLLLITKTVKKSTQTCYQFRDALPLLNLCVSLFSTSAHPFGIKFTSKSDEKLVLLFNARNDLDRQKFVDDLKESILEVIETEKVS